MVLINIFKLSFSDLSVSTIGLICSNSPNDATWNHIDLSFGFIFSSIESKEETLSLKKIFSFLENNRNGCNARIIILIDML